MRKLNLGCGPIQPHGWDNVDGSMRAWFASRLSWADRFLSSLKVLPPTEFSGRTQYANLTKRLPWPDNSAGCVYLGEVLEHFTRDDGLHLLAECYRVLEPGGIIRIRVPDNVRFWRNYLQEYDETAAKPTAEWDDRHSRWVEMFFRDICVRRRMLGSYGHYHKWMYDEVSLIKTLQKVGFEGVTRRAYLDSSIPNIKEVESHEDLTVEGRKPTS